MRSTHAWLAGCAACCLGAAALNLALAARAQAPAPAAASGSSTSQRPPQPPRAGPVVALRRTNEEWRELLSRIPELQTFAKSFVAFGASATQAALQRAGQNRASASAWTFNDGPFAWSPAPNRQFWIVIGSDGARTLIAVLSADLQHPRHLASTVIAEAGAPLAVGYSQSNPAELLWTSCFGCAGQGGSIQLGADGKPSFSYR